MLFGWPGLFPCVGFGGFCCVIANYSLYQQALHRARATVLILGSSDAGSVGLSAISSEKAAFGARISHFEESNKLTAIRCSKVFFDKSSTGVFSEGGA
jgi:hypothetical protein